MRRGVGRVSGATVPYINQGEPAKPAGTASSSGIDPRTLPGLVLDVYIPREVETSTQQLR